MNYNYKVCNKILKNIDTYIFVLCNNYKINIANIQKLLNIKTLPKKMFDGFKIKNNFEKVLYTDNYKVIFYGVEESQKCSNNSLYHMYGLIGKKISTKDNLDKNILIDVIGTDYNIIKNQVISFILGNYEYNELKTNKQNEKDMKKTIYFYNSKKTGLEVIEKAILQATIQNEIRTLINKPVNILNSTSYLKYIKHNIKSTNIKLKILNEEQLKKLGCNLILSVNQGSKNKALMVILEYKNIKKSIIDKPIVLLGKGVMYDTGGYNLKHGDMSDMKSDMTGSAIVYALLKLLSINHIEGHYIGILPIVENDIGSIAVKPGDIVKSYIGKTVEILNTDAEGRLILADALGYAKNYNPYLCIDIGTLSGQTSSIFGDMSTMIMGTNNKYIQKMIKLGNDNNEKIWELPMWEEYIALTKSQIADLRNDSKETRAGAIMVGAFLYNFVPKNSKWIHLDIAGVSYIEKHNDIRHYGGTGELLRTLYDFMLNIDKD